VKKDDKILTIVVAVLEVNMQENNISSLALANVEALARGNDNWYRNDQDCIHRVSGKIGSTVTILGIKCTVGLDGYARYVCGSCKTECSSGGKQQCSAKYCQSII